MGRGAYDTTGVIRPRGVPQASAGGLPASQAHESCVIHQVTAPEAPHFLDLLPDPMDIDPSHYDDTDRNEAGQTRLSTTDAAKPQMPHNVDPGAAIQSS